MKELLERRDNYLKEMVHIETRIDSLEHRLAGLRTSIKMSAAAKIDKEQSVLEELKKKYELYKFYVSKINLFLTIAARYEAGLIPDSVYRQELEEMKKTFPDIALPEPIPAPRSEGLEFEFGPKDVMSSSE